ncbi:hypothetical protein MNBD_GAMMA20-117 [hydrothermal vent metagenome]|uniref:Uncharacterized protein n=1 Tax=hydrothermal vent metagenome TaxID=652676 RepID=A0A3B1AT32_9ZZZZ
MTYENQMVESHVKEYTSRLKHIDELITRAGKAEIQKEEHQSKLSNLKQEREKLADHLDKIQVSSAEEWAKEGGPMVIWDLVAQRLEKLIEHIEQSKETNNE